MLVLLFALSTLPADLTPAQKRPPDVINESLAVGTIDKISADSITVNRLKGGEPLTFTYNKDCKFRLDGLSVEQGKIKRGMKVIIEGRRVGKEAYLVQAFDKDPLPK